MLKTFNKDYYINHRGCYSENKMLCLVENNPHFTLEDFLNWNISIKDKFYFVRNYTKLTIKQKQLLALECAKVSVKIYELKYSNDKRIANGVSVTEQFINGSIDLETFNISRKEIKKSINAAAAAAAYAATYAATYAAAAAACAAAAAAYAAAYAADDAAYASVSYAADAAAADAADDAAYAADDAAYAADAADDAIHTNNLLQALKDFCKNQD